MATLSELTDRSAVERAIQEFRELGRDRFLDLYGLERSRDYFVLVDGDLFDSKPILAVAFRNQHPDHGLLSVGDFSGGRGGGGAVRALRRLGFKTVTHAHLHPPSLGEEHATRTAIYETYGGDKVAGIIRFPGEEDIVNVFSDAEGPYADDPPTLTEPFGYRGEGLSGPQRLSGSGNVLLERARTTRAPVRFWYRPTGGQFSFLTWVAVLGRAWVAGIGQDGQPRPELEWRMEAVLGPSLEDWPSDVVAAIDDSAATLDSDESPPEAQVAPSYSALIDRINRRGQPRRPTGVVRTDFARSAAARRAVLIRSAGRCESPRCTGMPAETNRAGQPILDVDHIQDLAKGGEDHPRNMVALCPNCHACKTRGRNPARWRRELLHVAMSAHEAKLSERS